MTFTYSKHFDEPIDAMFGLDPFRHIASWSPLGKWVTVIGYSPRGDGWFVGQSERGAYSLNEQGREAHRVYRYDATVVVDLRALHDEWDRVMTELRAKRDAIMERAVEIERPS